TQHAPQCSIARRENAQCTLPTTTTTTTAAGCSRELDRPGVNSVVSLPRIAEEVQVRCRRVGRRTGRDVIYDRRTRRRRVVAEYGTGHWVRHRQWTPADVDPVVALVHGRGWRQVEDRLGHGRVRDARRHLVAPRLKFRRHSRTVAVLADNARVGLAVIQAAITADIRQYRIPR